MTEVSRRGFLKGLIAGAIATQLPALPKAEAAKLADLASKHLRVDGLRLTESTVMDIGNGWKQLCVSGIKEKPDITVGISAGGEGQVSQTVHTGPVNKESDDYYTVSCCIKIEDENTIQAHGASLTEDIKTSAYDPVMPNGRIKQPGPIPMDAIEPGPYNHMRYSDDVSNAVWKKS